MYITLQSIKRNLGLFNLTIEDLIVASVFGVTFTILFLVGFYTIAIIIVSLGLISLCPIDFSKTNRIYKLFILFTKYLLKNKNYYYKNNQGVI